MQDVRPADTVYRERRDRFAGEHAGLSRRWNALANTRLAAALGALVCLVWAARTRPPAAIGAGCLLVAIFVVLASYHGRIGRRRRRAALLRDLNDEQLRRLARDWAALPLRHRTQAAAGHPYAADLDVLGHASLFHLLETVTTPMGDATLDRWLTAPAAVETVDARQAAVRELAPLLDLRQELGLRGRLREVAKPDPGPFLAWAEGHPWLTRRPWLLWATRISPALLWLALALQVLGVIQVPVWPLPLLANLALALTLGTAVYPTLAEVAAQEVAISSYGDMLAVLSSTDFAAPELRRLQADLTAGGHPADAQLRRLRRLASFVLPRSFPLHLILQALTLWDFQVLAALERWQSDVGSHARSWLTALGDAEALSALAGLAHDNPDWAFPELDPATDTFVARGLGHPLLADRVRVVNDVEVGPPGTFLLVTGSNMSGKSTLLRAIGVNVVLAQAGGPVCAEALRLPPLSLWTSVRVQDSLERGVSFFMAELQRLKQVVDAARATAIAGEGRQRNRRTLCYLLDEILQGTNTVERQIAARRVIAFLVAQGAIGAVSTHDLTLADTAALDRTARPVHLTETLTHGPSGASMSFDYRLRPGLATSTNALQLMDLVGLDLDEGEPVRPTAGQRSGGLD